MAQQTNARRERQEREIEQAVSISYKDAYQLGYKVAVNSLVRSYSIAQERDSETEYQIVCYLKNIVNNMEFYNNCFVYFPQHDRIISTNQSSPVMNYLSEIYRKDQIPVMELLEGNEEKGLVVIGNETGRKRLFYIRSITSNTGTEQAVKVFVEWNLSYLKERMSLLMPENDACLLGTDDTYILSVGDSLTEEPAENLYKKLCTKEPVSVGELGIDGMEAERLYPETAELRLYYLAGKTSGWNLYSRTFSFAGLELILCVLISFGLVYYFGKYHTGKLKRIVDALSKEKWTSEDGSRNEYEQILSYVDLYQKDYVSIHEQSARYKQVCQSLYMRNILLGNVLDTGSIQESMKLYEIDFPYEYYEILAFSLDPEMSEERPDINVNDEVEIRMLADAIRAEILSWSSPEDRLFLMEMSGRYLCILNLDGISEETERYSERLQENILQILKSFGLADYGCLKSGIFHGTENIAGYYAKMNKNPNDEYEMEEPEKEIGECVQKCLEIIRTQYQDAALSTDRIAEQLRVSRSHLSSLFKQQIGIGLLDYIHRYRINEFKKEIQKNPKIRLQEATERIGFSNQASLIRVFKKIEGMTPGQYRDELLKKQNQT